MYTVSKGPSKIVAKTRRGLSQNYEKFETIKESGKRSEKNSPENLHVPRPVFQTIKKSTIHTKQTEEEVITPQHEEIIKYINDSWNIIVAHNPYDTACNGTNGSTDTNNNNSNNKINSASSSSIASSICSVGSSSASSPSSSSPSSSSVSSMSVSSSASSSACTSPAVTPPPQSTSQSPLQSAVSPNASIYCVEPPSPVLSDFKPFDLESWWGRRLFNNITKSL